MDLIYVEAEARNLRLELHINDVPVATLGEGGQGRAFVPATPFLVMGRNELSLHAAPSLGVQGSDSKAFCRIARMNDGDRFFADAGETIVRLEQNQVAGPIILTETFSSPSGPVAWPWQDAQRWPAAADATRDAQGFIDRLGQAIFASDAEWIAQASARKFDDMALALPNLTRAEIEAMARAEIAQSAPAPAPQTSAGAHQLCGGGRLLRLMGFGGAPLWIKPAPDGPVNVSAIIGKLAGAWAIIR